MWTCLNCNWENPDTIRRCWKCGATPDGEKLPSSPPYSMADSSLHQRPQVAHMPRRFGIGTMMVITACYAVLFSILKMMGAEWQVFLYISLFIAGVGVGQMFLFHGRKPRRASMVAGIIVGSILSLFVILINAIGTQPINAISITHVITQWLSLMLWPGIIAFSIDGYLAGLLVAGIFLFCERKEQAEEAEEERKKERGVI